MQNTYPEVGHNVDLERFAYFGLRLLEQRMGRHDAGIVHQYRYRAHLLPYLLRRLNDLLTVGDVTAAQTNEIVVALRLVLLLPLPVWCSALTVILTRSRMHCRAAAGWWRPCPRSSSR